MMEGGGRGGVIRGMICPSFVTVDRRLHCSIHFSECLHRRR